MRLIAIAALALLFAAGCGTCKKCESGSPSPASAKKEPWQAYGYITEDEGEIWVVLRRCCYPDYTEVPRLTRYKRRAQAEIEAHRRNKCEERRE